MRSTGGFKEFKVGKLCKSKIKVYMRSIEFLSSILESQPTTGHILTVYFSKNDFLDQNVCINDWFAI